MSLSGYTTRDLAGDLEALLDHLNIRCAHLMGHSYGGAIALHFAVLQPTRVASLTLADVRIRSLQPGQGVHEWPHWPGLRQQFADNGIDLPREGPNLDFRFLEALARRRLDGNVGHLTSGRFPLPFLFGNRQRAQQWLKLVGETTAAHDFQDTAGLTPEEIRKVVQPTLAIYGELSYCLPSLQALGKILPDCTTILVKGAGHFHPLVRPHMLLRRVRHFLKRVGRKTSRTPSDAPSLL
jgi:pimeloyl-ACP methyl ester carboxylesterase